MNKSIILKIVALCLICFVAGGLIVYASTPTGIMTLSGGVYPGSSSYTVFEDSGTVFAKNDFGVIDYSGSDGGDVISDAISNLGSDGGEIHVIGNIPCTTPVIIEASNVILTGEGAKYDVPKSSLEFSGAINGIEISGSLAWDAIIDIALLGDGSTLDAINVIGSTYGISFLRVQGVSFMDWNRGIYTEKSYHGLISHSYFRDTIDNSCIYLNSTSNANVIEFCGFYSGDPFITIEGTAGSHENKIINNWFEKTTTTGIMLLGAYHQYIENNYFSGPTYGISASNLPSLYTDYIFVKDNFFYSSVLYPIVANDRIRFWKVDGNIMTGDYGFYDAEDTQYHLYCTFSNNKFYGLGDDGTESCIYILKGFQYCIIADNIFSTSYNAIYADNDMYNCTITGNVFQGLTNYIFQVDGTNSGNIIEGNMGLADNP